MKEATVLLDQLKGINNAVDSERTKPGDLVSATNIDLDESGKPVRRLGFTKRISGAPKSFYGAGQFGYFMEGGALKLFAPPSTTITLRSGLDNAKRVNYVDLLNTVYYSNGDVTGKIVNKQNKAWGTPVPAAADAFSTSGRLSEGTYGYTTTFVRSNGQESGAPQMRTRSVSDDAGISLFNIPVSSDPEVTKKNVYFTGRNGETPFLVGSIPNSQTIYSYSHDIMGSVPVATMFRGPPPSGHLLTYYNGRIFIAQGEYLWYTEAFSPELVDYRSGYIPLGEQATVLASVESGLFVATASRTIFLSGDSPDKFVFTEVAHYGAPLGNWVRVDGSRVTKDGLPKSCAAWMSSKGLCVGASDGTLTNLTQDRYVLDKAGRTATTYKDRGGLTQFISVLFN